MKLIVGLGNPGPQYAHTRHNIGFMVVDQLAEKLGAAWKGESKFHAEVASVELSTESPSEKLILAKPQTMMNLSGDSVQKIMHFYKLQPTDVWVLFDDVDVPFGRLRIRRGGSSGGHQGVSSTIRHIGDQFLRVRIGISLNDRDREPSEIYVLKPFNPDEREQLPAVISKAANILERQLAAETPEETTFDLLAN